MFRRHIILTGIVIALLLLFIAIAVYPGGSMFDEKSVGFDWSKNFISNLFASTAINGQENSSRIWACLAMIILPVTYAIFFINMSDKLPDKNASRLIKYGGLFNILCMSLVLTPLHDLMLNISITLFWTCIFIVTIFVLRTKLHLLKICCIACLVIFYYGIYLWATNDWIHLPAMQKLNFISSTLLILILEYFTSQQDFASVVSPDAGKINKGTD